LAEVHKDYDQLNIFYISISDWQSHISPEMHAPYFCDYLNPIVLAEVYEEVNEVLDAFPLTLLCLDNMSCCCQIAVTRFNDLFRYAFYYPFGPAPDYGFCWQTRTFETDDVGSLSQVACTDSCFGECP
jgi:hypothetical protein